MRMTKWCLCLMFLGGLACAKSSDSLPGSWKILLASFSGMTDRTDLNFVVRDSRGKERGKFSIFIPTKGAAFVMSSDAKEAISDPKLLAGVQAALKSMNAAAAALATELDRRGALEKHK